MLRMTSFIYLPMCYYLTYTYNEHFVNISYIQANIYTVNMSKVRHPKKPLWYIPVILSQYVHSMISWFSILLRESIVHDHLYNISIFNFSTPTWSGFRTWLMLWIWLDKQHCILNKYLHRSRRSTYLNVVISLGPYNHINKKKMRFDTGLIMTSCMSIYVMTFRSTHPWNNLQLQ